MASHAKISGKQKKISTKTQLRTTWDIESSSIPKRGVWDYLVSISKSNLLVEAAKAEVKFASNGIHTKSGADNLQGNGLRKGLCASQFTVRRGSQNSGLKLS